MAHKLLQKTRNKFLQHTPPENLIPKRGVKKKGVAGSVDRKRRPYRRISFHQQEKSLINNRYLSTSAKQNTPVAANAQQLGVHTPWRVEETRLPLENLIKPEAHSAADRLHQIAGKSIVRALTITPLEDAENAKEETRKGGGGVGFNPKATLQLQGVVGETSCSAAPHAGISLQGFKSCQPFYIQWFAGHVGNRFFTNFLKNALHRNSWNCLFSIYDINRKRSRVNDQYKNQYIEYKKLSILYGNLPRRTLARTMHRAKKEGGEIESKFLSILERRLDVALKRALFFPTIYSARQWIHQGKILVNNQVCTFNSYLLQPADLITLKKECTTAWRKEWWAHFRPLTRIRGLHAGVERGDLQGVKIVHKKRRFHLSPALMQKWAIWGKLWGNTNCNGPARGNVHRWSWGSYLWGNFSHPLFNDTPLAHYLQTPSEKGKGSPPLYGGHAERGPKESNVEAFYPCTDAFPSTKRPFTSLIPALQQLRRKVSFTGEGGCVIGNSSNRSTRKEERKSAHLMQSLSALLLLRQQPNAVDGCFQHRWNKIFTKRKLIPLKRKDWQWSCMKPMHFECSYKRPTVVYLYPPQKLVWPSSVNVLLLKRALNY